MPDAGWVPRWLRKLRGYRPVQMLLYFARGAEQRESAMLRLRGQADLFQPFGTTRENRYPRVFAALRAALGAQAPVRLLSWDREQALFRKRQTPLPPVRAPR